MHQTYDRILPLSDERIQNAVKRKMKRAVAIIVFFVYCFIAPSLSMALPEKSNSWEKWLAEVGLIMTSAEKAVFKNLSTEEDKKRFKELFWRARNPNPGSPQNEYMMEYYRRRNYAQRSLGGADSDRGRIYIILGEPTEKHNLSGNEKIFDCELWIYEGLRRPGLPPFIHLIFFKPRNLGDYKIFLPGIHAAMDLLSPSGAIGVGSQYRAYQLLRIDFPELAQATLSVIPGEGDPASGSGIGSSGTTFAQIYELPEKEVQKSYIKNFAAREGNVDVSYTTKQIGGRGSIAISENRGFKFLNFALLPEDIHTTKTADGFNLAEIALNLRLEDLTGKTIYQQEKKIELKIDDAKKKAMLEDERLVFKDFAPIIEGEFNAIVTLSNKTADEFLVYKEKINTMNKTIPVLIGFDIRSLSSDNFMPFSSGGYKVFLDPRSIYDKGDSLAGMIFTVQRPKIELVNIEDQKEVVEVKDIAKQADYFVFKHPAKDIKSGNYFLSIRDENEEVFSKVISVLSFDIKKPKDFEWSDGPGSTLNYFFLLGQQYLNSGDADAAVRCFQKLPRELWNSTSVPIIARALFMKQDYERVLGLLEKEGVEKDFPVLTLLAHSSLKLGRLQPAAEYFERLRKYGDTAEINRFLGRIYDSLGDREKAQVYLERAKKLEKKSN